MNIDIAKDKFISLFPNLTFLSIEKIGGGHINFTYLVEYQENNCIEKVVFQYLNPMIFPNPSAIYNNISKVAEHLRFKNYRYKILDFHPSLKAPNDSAWRIFPYFEDTLSFESCEYPNLAYKAAKAFGHHFAKVSDFPLDEIQTIIPKFQDAQWRWSQFQSSLENAKQERLFLASNQINKLKTEFHLVEKYKQLIQLLPKRITHNDTKIANLLFEKKTNNPLVIIDLDTLQLGTILSDFGDMVRSYCPSHSEEYTNFDALEFRNEMYEALKKGFLEETNEILTDIEKESLYFAGELTIFVQSLRFLTDFLNNDIYYQITYPEHNLNRSKNQMRLLEKMRCL